jgi:hypothetical protein
MSEGREKEEGAIVPTPTEAVTPIVVPPLEPDEIKKHFDKIQLLKRKLIDPEADMIKIGNKPYILKSGWRKLSFAFNLSDEILREEKEERGDEVIYRIWTKVTAPNGRYVVAVGCASSKERKFFHEAHDPYALAATRSKNRAISDIIGLGEVSAEEMLGVEEKPEVIEVKEDVKPPPKEVEGWKEKMAGKLKPETTATTTKAEVATTATVAKAEPATPKKILEAPPGAKFITSHGKPYGYIKAGEGSADLYFDPPLDLNNLDVARLVESFLYGRVLDQIKKTREEKGLFFSYTPIVENNQLQGISFAADPEALDDATIREISSSAGWTAARAAEKG